MRAGLYLIFALIAAISFQGLAIAQTSDDDFVHRRIAASGFTPLGEMAFGDRDVRRVLPIDPHGLLPIPGIELERHRDGRLTLRAQYRTWTGVAYPVSRAEWDRLALLEAAAFGPPGKSTFKARPGLVIHCWSGLLEAVPRKAASWWACNNGTKAAQAYTEAVLVLAMQKKGCAPSDKSTLWGFSACFTDANKLEDPVLQERFGILRDRWLKQREPGSTILAQARLSLRAAREDRTPVSLMKAHQAVLAFGRQQKALREILHSSFTDLPDSESMDGRSAAILNQTRRGWDGDITAQDKNYIDLLEDIARLWADSSRPKS
jgi:hypothetical protein